MRRLEEAQAQGVHADREARQTHGSGADHGIEADAKGRIEDTRSQGDADDVVEEGPEQVFFDILDDSLAQADGADGVEEVAAHEDGIGAFDGDVGPGTDGHAQIGFGQGRRIIDAVTNHGDFMAFGLEGGDVFFFILRQDAGNDLGNMQALADGFGCALVVACEHDDVDAHFGKVGNGFGAGRFFDVGYGDDADDFLVVSKEERRLAVVGQGIEAGRDGFGVDMGFVHEARVAGIIGLAVDDGLDAAAEEGLEIAGCPAGQLMVAGIGRNSFGQGMFAAFFQGSSDGDEVFFRAFQGKNIRDFRTAFGNGTGLVHDDRVDGMGRFQGFAGFDEDTVFSPFASADHDGDWRSQAQGARAGDDQDGDGRREGEFGVDAHDEVPDEACNDGDGDDGRDEVTRNGIGHLGDRCLAGAGFIDELDDLADRRVVADAAGCDVDETRLVYRSRRDFIADLFFYRDAFAGNGGFIDAGRPFRNDTVCRDAFARTDDDFITDDEVFDGNDRFDAVAQDRGLFRRQVHQFFDGRAGLAFGAGFEIFTDVDEGDDHTG